ncbi:MAG: GNAT family N-acetyltransferase [Mycobacteriaceae bacterium]|nr:GNAT family N-acetyltransferase [Mycobacteriaceae bacterium]
MTVAVELGALPVFAGIPTDELTPLAAELTPIRAPVGEVLMRQGEKALSFLIIASGEAEVRHTDTDGQVLVAFLSEGLIGEIALLRNAPRTATVVATDEVCGYLGYEPAFELLLQIPGIAPQLVRTARQRLAAFLTPVPFEARDDTELMLRPVLPGDTQRVVHGQVMFSPETLYRRFLSVRAPSETVLTYLFEVDYVDHFVWVVTDGAEGPVIADARFVRDQDDPTLAEIAFTVADEYQGRGIGTVLFAALAVAARVDGVTKFHARVLSDNLPARALLDRLDAPWIREEPGIVAATIEVPDPARLPVKIEHIKEIQDVARQVIRAFE